MSATTLAQAISITGQEVLDYLEREAAVPVVTTSGVQGDVSVLRVTAGAATTPMAKRVVVVSSEVTPNTHTLHPNGPCFFDMHTPTDPSDVLLGTVTVPVGSTALLMHQEHGALEIAPGTYRVGRQREYAAGWAYVAD